MTLTTSARAKIEQDITTEATKALILTASKWPDNFDPQNLTPRQNRQAIDTINRSIKAQCQTLKQLLKCQALISKLIAQS